MSDIIPEKRANKDKFEYVIVAFAAAIVIYMMVSIFYLYVAVGEAWNSVWQDLFNIEVYEASIISILSAFIVGGLAVAAAIPIAYLITYKKFRGKETLKTLLIDLPQTFPPVTEGLVYLLLFSKVNLAFTFAAVVIAKFYVSAPFAISFTTRRFGEIKESGLDVLGRSLGANTAQILGRVILPLSKRDILGGFSLTWARAMGELAATLVFAGVIPGITETLPTLVYITSKNDPNLAMATSIIAETLSIIALLLFKWIGKRKQ